MGKKLTISELIAQKEKLKNNKQGSAVLHVESLDSDIVVTLPGSAIILEAQEAGEADATRADAYIIFQCVKEPNLKDDELQKAYECIEPLDIVDKIFLPGEIAGIAAEIMKLAGFGTSITRVGKDIKN